MSNDTINSQSRSNTLDIKYGKRTWRTQKKVITARWNQIRIYKNKLQSIAKPSFQSYSLSCLPGSRICKHFSEQLRQKLFFSFLQRCRLKARTTNSWENINTREGAKENPFAPNYGEYNCETEIFSHFRWTFPPLTFKFKINLFTFLFSCSFSDPHISLLDFIRFLSQSTREQQFLQRKTFLASLCFVWLCI